MPTHELLRTNAGPRVLGIASKSNFYCDIIFCFNERGGFTSSLMWMRLLLTEAPKTVAGCRYIHKRHQKIIM